MKNVIRFVVGFVFAAVYTTAFIKGAQCAPKKPKMVYSCENFTMHDGKGDVVRECAWIPATEPMQSK